MAPPNLRDHVTLLNEEEFSIESRDVFSPETLKFESVIGVKVLRDRPLPQTGDSQFWKSSEALDVVGEHRAGATSPSTPVPLRHGDGRADSCTRVVTSTGAPGGSMIGPDVIAALDVGSVSKGNVGWCHRHKGEELTGRDLDDLGRVISDDLASGLRVALGFEAPLFVPLPDTEQELCKARSGEGSRPWSAAGGLGSMGIAVQESAYVLGVIASRLSLPITVAVEADGLVDPNVKLVLWEAFVSGKAKDMTSADPHIADARAAVAELARRIESNDVASDVSGGGSVFSLIGAAVLRSGLSADLSLLSTECLVVKAPMLD